MKEPTDKDINGCHSYCAQCLKEKRRFKFCIWSSGHGENHECTYGHTWYDIASSS